MGWRVMIGEKHLVFISSSSSSSSISAWRKMALRMMVMLVMITDIRFRLNIRVGVFEFLLNDDAVIESRSRSRQRRVLTTGDELVTDSVDAMSGRAT